MPLQLKGDYKPFKAVSTYLLKPFLNRFAVQAYKNAIVLKPFKTVLNRFGLHCSPKLFKTVLLDQAKPF